MSMHVPYDQHDICVRQIADGNYVHEVYLQRVRMGDGEIATNEKGGSLPNESPKLRGEKRVQSFLFLVPVPSSAAFSLDTPSKHHDS